MRHRVLVLAILGILGISARSSAQQEQFVVVGTKTTAYPNVETQVVGLDNVGEARTIPSDELTLKNNGKTITTTITCKPAGTTNPISMMIAVDVSATTASGTPKVIDMAKEAAKNAASALSNTNSEIGLVQFDANARLLYGMSTNTGEYLIAANSLATGRGSNLTEGLNNVPFGAFSQLQSARFSRSIVIITDGASTIDLNAMLNACRVFKIKVFVIGLASSVSPSLRLLADSSGGGWAENITTTADAIAHMQAYSAVALGKPTCTLSWTVDDQCSLTQRVDVSNAKYTRSQTILSPLNKIKILTSDKLSLDYGELQPGVKLSDRVVLLAENGDINVTSITLSNPHFKFTQPQGAFTLANGSSKVIEIEYTATDSAVAIGTLDIISDACTSAEVFMRAGFLVKDNELKITSPNGGENLLAGAPTQITWTGTLPDDYITLEVSTNNGTSWSAISQSAHGNAFTWYPGPATSNNQALIRAERTLVDPSKSVILRAQQTALYTAAFTRDGSQVVTGAHDGSVRLFDATTGGMVRIVGTHAQFVWSVATHPSLPYAASASFDGTVRVWNYMNGQQLATVSTPGKAYCVTFNQDGSTMYVGGEQILKSIRTSDWSEITSTSSVKGIVYDIKCTTGEIVTAEGSSAVVRQAATLGESFTVVTSPKIVYSVAISPDKKTVAIGGADGTVHTYNYQSKSEIAKTEAYIGSITSLDYSPDGATLLSSGLDGVPKIHSAATLEVLNTLPGHTGGVYTSRFNKTGSSVVSASTDKTARIWDIAGLHRIKDQSNATFSIVGGIGAPSDITFDNVMLGTGLDVNRPVMRNNGSAPLVISSMRLVDGNQLQDFQLINPPASDTLAPNEVLNLDASYIPTVVGDAFANLEIVTGTGVKIVKLTGKGVAPDIDVDSTKNFGRAIANVQKIDSIVRVQLPPGATKDVNVTGIEIVGVQSSAFSFVEGSEAFILTPARPSHDIKIRFEPTSDGRYPAVLELTIGNNTKFYTRLYGEGTGDATISARPQESFQSEKCEFKPSTTTTTISNTGNSNLTIYAAVIEGRDGAEFTVTESTGKTYPFTIPANGTARFNIAFNPVVKGAKQAVLVFTSNAVNAMNSRTSVVLLARQDSIAYELSKTEVLFSNVPEFKPQEQIIRITNKSTESLHWPRGPIVLNGGAFTIVSITPEYTPIDGTSDVTIRFNGAAAGANPSATYTFKDSVCGRSVDLSISATVKMYIGFTISVDTIQSNTGQNVNVPVRIKDRVRFEQARASEVRVFFSTNSTMLVATGNAQDVIVQGDTLLTFNALFTIPSSGEDLGTLNFNTFWGNDTAAVIAIDSVQISDTIIVSTQPGMVRMADLCRAGGSARLIYTSAQSASIDVAPNPAVPGGSVKVGLSERGLTKLEMVDITGRVVGELVKGNLVPGTYQVQLPEGTLQAGAYYLILTTPTEVISQRIDILK